MDDVVEFKKSLEQYKLLQQHIKYALQHPKQVLQQRRNFPYPLDEMSNREFEIAKFAADLYAALNSLVNQLELGNKILTDGCDKNWCLGTDGRSPKCPNCGSVWDDKLGSRVIE